MRAAQRRNAVPGYSAQVNIFHAGTIKVNFVNAGEAFDLFGHATLGAVALVNERRKNNQPRPTDRRRHEKVWLPAIPELLLPDFGFVAPAIPPRSCAPDLRKEGRAGGKAFR